MKLTSRQGEVLMYIRIFIADHGYAPTLREIGAFFGWTSTNATSDHLRSLIRKGYLTRARGKSRAMRVTQKGEEWG